jgi:phosphoribosyl 1,2-cyclic phosphodiesterase
VVLDIQGGTEVGNERNSLTLSVLGSGSNGNSILLSSPSASILIDAGFSCAEIEKRLSLFGLKGDDISALLISHEHQDHVKGADLFSRKYKVPLYLTPGTRESWGMAERRVYRFEMIEAGSSFALGGIEIHPFSLPHDAADPVGFIASRNGIKVGIALDLGSPSRLVKTRLAGSNVLILEANYDTEMLRNGPYPPSLKQRVSSRLGHLSNEELADMLCELATPELRFVFLAHISKVNNYPELALLSSRLALSTIPGISPKIILTHQDRPTALIKL